jgi:hypothetical protein
MLAACLIVVSAGAAIGIATGVFLGSAYWSAIANGVPAVARPVVPLGVTTLVTLGTLAVAGLVAFVPRLARSALQPIRSPASGMTCGFGVY